LLTEIRFSTGLLFEGTATLLNSVAMIMPECVQLVLKLNFVRVKACRRLLHVLCKRVLNPESLKLI